ncbi:hypothetical protein QOU23_01515, partial [Pseudomonas aeruginosa]
LTIFEYFGHEVHFWMFEIEFFRPSLERLLTDESAYLQMSFAHNPYGDGEACQRIVQALLV